MTLRNVLNPIREKILDVATELFFERGLQSVGIDEIVAKAGIAKMTLYKYFLSKDQLILAIMQRCEDQWWQWFILEVKKRAKTPGRQLLVIFDVLAESFVLAENRGAPFVKAKIRVSDSMYPILLASSSFQHQLREFILEIVKAANISNSSQFVDMVMLLIIGANITANLDGQTNPDLSARVAKKIVATLIKEKIKEKNSDHNLSRTEKLSKTRSRV